MSRTKSAGPRTASARGRSSRPETPAGQPVTIASRSATEEIRNVSRRLAPYIVREWREVCEQLGVADDILDDLERQYEGQRKSELAFQGICKWQEMAGRSAHKDKILKAIQLLGLKRAEEEFRSLDLSKRRVPYMGQPEKPAPQQEVVTNKHVKQRALADRLSRPKTSTGKRQEQAKAASKKAAGAPIQTNLLVAQMAPSRASDLCEVKVKVTVKGIQRKGDETMESTRDDFKSTKNDFKQVCHTFVKAIMANQKAHFLELKRLLGFSGVSMQRLSKVGFNINIFILCHTLGAFEILNQTHITGRLSKIVHSALLTPKTLARLNAQQMELSVEMDDVMTHKYREILILRSGGENEARPAIKHPVNECEFFVCDDDDVDENTSTETFQSLVPDLVNSFDLCDFYDSLQSFVDDMRQRLHEVDDNMNDLLMTLRILRKSKLDEITCLQDLIDCLHQLRLSKSVGSVAKTDLIRNFIAFPNLVRLKVEDVKDKDIYISFCESLPMEACDEFHKRLADIEEMLEPTYTFKTNPVKSERDCTYTGLHQEMFGGLVRYLPSLVERLQCLVETLNPDFVPDPNTALEATVLSEKSDDDKENESMHNQDEMSNSKDGVNESLITKEHDINGNRQYVNLNTVKHEAIV